MKFEVQKRRDRSGQDVQAVVGVGDLGAITILLEVGDEALLLASILNGSGVKASMSIWPSERLGGSTSRSAMRSRSTRAARYSYAAAAAIGTAAAANSVRHQSILSLPCTRGLCRTA